MRLVFCANLIRCSSFCLRTIIKWAETQKPNISIPKVLLKLLTNLQFRSLFIRVHFFCFGVFKIGFLYVFLQNNLEHCCSISNELWEVCHCSLFVLLLSSSISKLILTLFELPVVSTHIFGKLIEGVCSINIVCPNISIDIAFIWLDLHVLDVCFLEFVEIQVMRSLRFQVELVVKLLGFKTNYLRQVFCSLVLLCWRCFVSNIPAISCVNDKLFLGCKSSHILLLNLAILLRWNPI